MKPVDFSLHRPQSVDEALTVLAEHPEEAKVLAGGQSLVPLLNFRLARPELLVDLGRIAALAGLRRTHDQLVVGSMVRQAFVEHSDAVAEHAPLLAAACPYIAHPPIRNRGTVGGSLAHADPAAELPAVARALDATFVATGPRGRREIPSHEFFRGHLVTALEPDELLVEIRFARAPARTGAAFEEVSRRRGDFALVGAGAQVSIGDGNGDADVVRDIRICLTGVASTPRRATEAEQLLEGHVLSERLLGQAAEVTADTLEPSTDLHATSDYRRHVAGEMLARAVRRAHQMASATKIPA
jgi:aerobic carbon-monoxide dehydrogenase medium subunit